MTTPVSRADLTTDTRGENQRAERLHQACEQFEAILLSYLVKSMRQSVLRAEEPDQTRELYESLMDESLADALSREQGIGLADKLYRELEPLLGDKPE